MFQVMIFAAGFGTRLRPFTQKRHKSLFLVNGATLLERNIAYLKTYAPLRFVINVHYRAEQIIQYIAAHKGWGLEYAISYEDSLLETGGGLKKALVYFDKRYPILTLNADVLTDFPLEELLQAYHRTTAGALVAVSERESQRGLLLDERQYVVGWQDRQKNAIRNTVDVSADQLSFRAFGALAFWDYALVARSALSGCFSLVDLLLETALKGRPAMSYQTCQPFRFCDVGSLEKAEKAKQLFQ